MFWQSAVLLLTLSLASIGVAQERPLQPLVVSYSSFTGNRAPLWIAKDLGLYEKYGLDVKVD
jgi:ABC-type nitrate/sulfonate/bicarbonate transport system substrate-binding protein